MSESLQQSSQQLRHRLNGETAKIQWHELQKHYAAGNVMAVSGEADLIEVAIAFHQDQRVQVQSWLNSGMLFEVNDAQAKVWFNNNQQHWAVVIPPFVLIQEVS